MTIRIHELFRIFQVLRQGLAWRVAGTWHGAWQHFRSKIPVKRVDFLCTDHFDREMQVQARLSLQ